ncbi:MAG: sigma 54-interacting transcriptional regulator [Candidatus Thiodiazotropha sp.]
MNLSETEHNPAGYLEAGQAKVAAQPMFHAFFDQHPTATLIFDPVENRMVDANSAAVDLLGFPIETLLQSKPSWLFNGGLSALIVFTQSVMVQGSCWTNELSCRTRGGRVIPVECNARSMTQNGQVLLSVTLQDRDVVEGLRKQADANDYVRRGLAEWRKYEQLFQEIEQGNQLLLQAAGDGIYGVNADGITTFINPAAERLLGYSADELVGKNMHEMVHGRHPDGSHYHVKQCPIYAAFNDGAVHHVDDEVFWRKDGSVFPVEYTSTPIVEHGMLIGAVIIFRDISDRKEAEEDLRSALEQVKSLQHRLEEENAYLQEEIRTEHNYREIIGSSAAIRQVIQKIQQVAPTNSTTLITGESGTGKELIARAMHLSSERSDRPLIRVNCAAIPRDLFESEFFGHVRGAFTGATRDRAGRFELADGGTLFLDEVGEIPLELQGKLLRVLQEGQYERIGEEKTRNVDVRIIAATNKDLAEEVTAKSFREDLYFRLQVFPIHLPPLRERPEDIPLLASHFLQTMCRKFNKRGIHLSQSDIRRLSDYQWSGNVRELENIIERAVIVTQAGRLRLDLPVPDTQPAAPPSPPMKLPADEKGLLLTESERVARDRLVIVNALEQAGGKVFGEGGAAELLGLKPTTLASRMKRLGIEKPKRHKRTEISKGT